MENHGEEGEKGDRGNRKRAGQRKGEEKRMVEWEVQNKKREIRRELKEWRRKGGERERHKRDKQEFTELCEKRRREENQRWKERLRK